MSKSLITLAMLLSTVCYGAAAVLQARAARAAHNDARLDPKFFAALVRQPLYLLALLISALGFAAQLPALRAFPLFIVQAAQACNLAVAALLAVPVLKEHLRMRDWLAVAGIVAGLWLLLASIISRNSIPNKDFGFGLLLWVAFLSAASYVFQRVQGTLGGAILGFLAGLAFGTVGVAVRSVQSTSLTALLLDPSTYALIISGVLAFLLYAIALDRSTVALATTALIVAQIGGSAIVGTLILGDKAKSGYGAMAAFGLALCVGGAITLARYAQPERGVQ
jgi:drug/metabolite transporter (DMT)-like permease